VKHVSPHQSFRLAVVLFASALIILWGNAAMATAVRYPAETIEAMRHHLLGYRDNMRVEVETGIAVTAKTVAGLRTLPAWPDGLAFNIHVDLDPRFSVVRVERAC
jgi:hypothetical protein